MADETPAIPGLNRRTLLRGGLAAGAGAAVAGLATVGLAGAAQAATAARSVARSAKPSAVEPDLTYQTQYYWAYCLNCAGLWYTANNTAGACPYHMLGTGGGHVLNPSYSYDLQYNLSGGGGGIPYQPGWNWCSRCQGLFFATNYTSSYCPAKPTGGRHNRGGDAYSLAYNTAINGAQGNWFWCGQCQGLFWDASPELETENAGVCPMNPPGPHVGGNPIKNIQSYTYEVNYYSTGPP
jgi:hypothetical protein